LIAAAAQWDKQSRASTRKLAIQGGAKMVASDDLARWCALNRLMAEYWADVDENGGRQAHEFYLPDGLYAIGNNRFEGREKIEAFYTRRRHSAIMTRHLLSNLRTLSDDEPCARIAGLMSLYRADGKTPFQGARPPAMIADFEARCVIDSDRQWRFQSHVLRPVIIGSDMPASITIKPQSL
jgi:SnoaL-like domain